MERLQGSHSLLGWNDSRGIILTWDRTTPGESFCLMIERLQGSHSVLGWKDSRGVILYRDGTTPGESFCPGIKRRQGSHSVTSSTTLMYNTAGSSESVSDCSISEESILCQEGWTALRYTLPRNVSRKCGEMPTETELPWC